MCSYESVRWCRWGDPECGRVIFLTLWSMIWQYHRIPHGPWTGVVMSGRVVAADKLVLWYRPYRRGKHVFLFLNWRQKLCKYALIQHHNQQKRREQYYEYFLDIVVILPSLELSIWLGHLFTTSWRFVDPLKTATALRTMAWGGGMVVLNLIGQKLARLTYSFLHTSE